MGTITALGPIAVGLAESAGINISMMLGALVGGAMFGDNLSIISDTTIAATFSYIWITRNTNKPRATRL